jgi:hypothetical protein
MESIGPLLGGFEAQEGHEAQRELKTESAKPLQTEQVAV